MLVLTKSKIGISLVLAFGVGSLAMASIPGKITDDTALYQELSEIRIQRRKKAINFDSDIKKLSRMEKRYNRAKTPSLKDHPRLARVIKRVSSVKYARKYYQKNRRKMKR